MNTGSLEMWPKRFLIPTCRPSCQSGCHLRCLPTHQMCVNLSVVFRLVLLSIFLVWGSIQWPVTLLKCCLLTSIGSDGDMVNYPHGLSHAFFIPLVASSIMERKVRFDMILALGCSLFTKYRNGCCWTTLKGSWTTYFNIALSMDHWDPVLVFTNVVCLMVEVWGGLHALSETVRKIHFICKTTLATWFESYSTLTSETSYFSSSSFLVLRTWQLTTNRHYVTNSNGACINLQSDSPNLLSCSLTIFFNFICQK